MSLVVALSRSSCAPKLRGVFEGKYTWPADITRVPGKWRSVFAYLVNAGKRLSEGRYPNV